MNPKPAKGRYRRKRQREKKAQRYAAAYGSDAYGNAVRATGCLVARESPNATACGGRLEAAHRVKKTRADSRGWRDLFCLCSYHHAEQERSLAAFEAQYRVDVLADCDRNADTYGALAA